MHKHQYTSYGCGCEARIGCVKQKTSFKKQPINEKRRKKTQINCWAKAHPTRL